MSEYVKNTENLNRLLDWLDNGAPHVIFSLDVMYADPAEYATELEDGEVFIDGDEVPSSCGAIACIAGAAAEMHWGTFGKRAGFEQEGHNWSKTQAAAIEFLGIDKDAITDGHIIVLDVFDPDVARTEMGRPAGSKDAAAALRNLAEFGEPRWGDLA